MELCGIEQRNGNVHSHVALILPIVSIVRHKLGHHIVHYCCSGAALSAQLEAALVMTRGPRVRWKRGDVCSLSH